VNSSSSAASTSSASSGAGSAAGSAAEELVGGYTRGSHRSIFQTHFTVRVLELENELYEQLFAEADNIGDARYEEGFLSVLSLPLKTYAKQMGTAAPHLAINL
jgi:hypothetical protein